MASRVVLFLWAFALVAAEPGVPVHAIGGTVQALQGGAKGRLDLAAAESLLFSTEAARLRIPYNRIHTLEYGQRVNRRYVSGILISPVLLLSKTRKHFVTLGYTDEAGARQALVFRVEKGDIRVVLAALEARSGRKVDYQDEEARHSGK